MVTLHILQVNDLIVRADRKVQREKKKKPKIVHDRKYFMSSFSINKNICAKSARFSTNSTFALFLYSSALVKINKNYKTMDTIKKNKDNGNGNWSIRSVTQRKLGQTLLNALKWMNATLFRINLTAALYCLLHCCHFTTYIMIFSCLLPVWCGF